MELIFLFQAYMKFIGTMMENFESYSFFVQMAWHTLQYLHYNFAILAGKQLSVVLWRTAAILVVNCLIAHMHK